MIVDLLTLTRPFIIFDLETTGFRPDDRVIEIGFQIYGPEGMMKEWRALINPLMPIPPGATAVHGISDAMVKGCRECGQGKDNHLIGDSCKEFLPCFTFAQLAPNLAMGFSGCDFGGKNVRFDLGKMAEEMARVNVPWSYAGARVICADRLEQLAEPRNLSALYTRRTSKAPLKAHSALDDVQMTAEVLDAQFRTFEQLPRDLDALHKLQWPDWIDSEGKFRFLDGVPKCWFGKRYKGQDMRTIPTDFYTWMLGQNFSPEVKAIAADAVAGKFPQ